MPFKESGHLETKNKPASFVELQQKPDVSAAELIATLKDYVESGAAISGSVVEEIIRRTELTPEDFETLKELAQKGANDQAARGFKRDATAYQRVVYHAICKLRNKE